MNGVVTCPFKCDFFFLFLEEKKKKDVDGVPMEQQAGFHSQRNTHTCWEKLFSIPKDTTYW